MSEIIFLSIAAAAAAFKVLAIVIGMVWAFRHLMTAHSAPLDYRYTHVKIPFRPWRRSN
jgi:hypothetical protein